MVLESTDTVVRFLKERYRVARRTKGDVFSNPIDVYDREFPRFAEEISPHVHDLASKLRDRYPGISDEDHVLMAYLLHVLDRREPYTAAPHRRLISAPARFFYEYLHRAGFDLDALLAQRDYKYKGIPISVLLDGISHDLGEHVLKKRFTPPRR